MELYQQLVIPYRVIHHYWRQKMAKPENVTCPECQGPMVPRTGRTGTFWGCKAFPKCKGTRDSMGRSLTERRTELRQERRQKYGEELDD